MELGGHGIPYGLCASVAPARLSHTRVLNSRQVCALPSHMAGQRHSRSEKSYQLIVTKGTADKTEGREGNCHREGRPAVSGRRGGRWGVALWGSTLPSRLGT